MSVKYIYFYFTLTGLKFTVRTKKRSIEQVFCISSAIACFMENQYWTVCEISSSSVTLIHSITPTPTSPNPAPSFRAHTEPDNNNFGIL
jgi:hypothetical protein